jgi:hypothetical protein
MAPSIRRFSPARGIFVDMAENSITITGRMQVWGTDATPEKANAIAASLNRNWSRVFSDGYTSQCTVTAAYRGKGDPEDSGVLQIEYSRNIDRSRATKGGGSFSEAIWLNSKDINDISWVIVHEFGHTLGMADRYTDEMRTINGTKQSVSVAHEGYGGLLMGADSGAMTSRALQDLQSETAPSENWVNDDDQVREWIKTHTAGDLATLSTAAKISALRTLMGGWISDEDVAAMTKVILSSRNNDESKAIRSSINPIDMTSIGQRTRIRIALSKMP